MLKSSVQELQNSRFILVRHAQSTYNETHTRVVEPLPVGDEETDNIAHKVATNIELIDARLSATGVQ